MCDRQLATDTKVTHSTWCMVIEWEEVEEPSNVRMSITPAQLMHRRVLEQRKHKRGNKERGGRVRVYLEAVFTSSGHNKSGLHYPPLHTHKTCVGQSEELWSHQCTAGLDHCYG